MRKGTKKREYSRIRKDTGQHRRITLTALFLGILAFVPIAVQLYTLMVRDYGYYARLALRNQTRTTQVTADRGIMYDRNMNILACSQSVENVYLDPHELKQSKANVQEIGQVLGEILDLDPLWIQEQAKDTKMRYKQIAARIDVETAARIRSYINENNISGIHLEPNSQRYYPYGTLAAQVIGLPMPPTPGRKAWKRPTTVIWRALPAV